MWAIIKFDKKQFEFLKRDFNKKLGKNFISGRSCRIFDHHIH